VRKTIQVTNLVGIRFSPRVVAERGVWCLHKGIGSDQGYTVTHTPTLLAAIKGVRTVREGRDAMRELVTIPGDWSFTVEEGMSKRQKRAGKRIARKYQVAEE